MRCNGPCERFYCHTCCSEYETYLNICRDCWPVVLIDERAAHADSLRAQVEKCNAYRDVMREIRDIDPRDERGKITPLAAIEGLSIAIAKARMALVRLDLVKVGTNV